MIQKNFSNFIIISMLGSLLYTPFSKATDNNKNSKLQAPIVIKGSLEEAKGLSKIVTFFIKPLAHCQNMVSTIRGLDGVKIKDPDSKTYDSCFKGMTVQHSTSLTTKKGKSGYVVIDVQFTVDSKNMTAQHILVVHNNGIDNGAASDTNDSFQKENMGQEATAADGRKFIIMNQSKTK